MELEPIFSCKCATQKAFCSWKQNEELVGGKQRALLLLLPPLLLPLPLPLLLPLPLPLLLLCS